MKRYNIYKEGFEFAFGRTKRSIPPMTSDEIFDWYESERDHCPDLLESFDNEQDAREAFTKHYAKWASTSAVASNVFWLLDGQVVWIEELEVEVDEDGDENDEYCGVVAFSADPYEAEIENEDLKRKVIAEGDGADPSDITNRDIWDAEKNNWLTENTCRNGHNVLWYRIGHRDACYDLEEERYLTEEEIEEQLC